MKALIIYDDFASVMKANSSLQNSAAHPDINAQWSIQPWRVDMLKFVLSRRTAHRDCLPEKRSRQSLFVPWSL